MTRRDWFFITMPLIVVWLIDQTTKMWASNLGVPFFIGPMGFMLHHNPGVILGTFSDVPPMLRIVSLSTGGAFLIFCFMIIQYLLPPQTLILRAGMSILLGGILGNVTDRIRWGYVVDFVVFRWEQWLTPAFNLADALQWVGYFLVIYCLFKDGKRLWPDQNLRKSFLIDPKYQFKYALKLTSFAFCFALLTGILSYTFLKVAIEELTGPLTAQSEHIMITFTFTFLIVSVAFCTILFFVGLMLAHKAAGPIYAFEKFLEDLYAGKTRSLKLRGGDEFQKLERMAAKLAKQWSKIKAS
ncbi:MAG: signal peptidase II [Bdellovibrionales bacterium]